MSKKLLSRFKAAFGGVTFAVAALVGASLPAVSANALTGSGPSNLTAVYNSSTNKIDLSWDALAGADVYQLTAYSDAARTNQLCGGFSNSNVDNRTSDHFGTYIDCMGSGGAVQTPLQSGSTYYFMLRATNSTESPSAYTDNSLVSATAGSSGASLQATGTPGSLAAVPVAGVNGSSQDHFALTWTAPTHDPSVTITGYRVEGRVAGSANWLLAGTAAQTTLDVSDIAGTAIDRTSTYEFRVAAIDSVQGLSSNWTTDTSSFATGSANQQSTPAPVNNGPKVPDTGFSLALANPFIVIAAGVIAAIAVALAGRKFVRR